MNLTSLPQDLLQACKRQLSKDCVSFIFKAKEKRVTNEGGIFRENNILWPENGEKK